MPCPNASPVKKNKGRNDNDDDDHNNNKLYSQVVKNLLMGI